MKRQELWHQAIGHHGRHLDPGRRSTEGYGDTSSSRRPGPAQAPTPWRAVQQAARDALTKLESGEATARDWTLTNHAPVW